MPIRHDLPKCPFCKAAPNETLPENMHAGTYNCANKNCAIHGVSMSLKAWTDRPIEKTLELDSKHKDTENNLYRRALIMACVEETTEGEGVVPLSPQKAAERASQYMGVAMKEYKDDLSDYRAWKTKQLKQQNPIKIIKV